MVIYCDNVNINVDWIPACAGMTPGVVSAKLKYYSRPWLVEKLDKNKDDPFGESVVVLGPGLRPLLSRVI